MEPGRSFAIILPLIEKSARKFRNPSGVCLTMAQAGPSAKACASCCAVPVARSSAAIPVRNSFFISYLDGCCSYRAHLLVRYALQSPLGCLAGIVAVPPAVLLERALRRSG